jgi:hypothetical protein
MTDLLASNPGFQNVCKPAKIRRRARGDRRRVLCRVKVFTVENQRSFNQQRGSWPYDSESRAGPREDLSSVPFKYLELSRKSEFLDSRHDRKEE